jgi:hypothetical protein
MWVTSNKPLKSVYAQLPTKTFQQGASAMHLTLERSPLRIQGQNSEQYLKPPEKSRLFPDGV